MKRNEKKRGKICVGEFLSNLGISIIVFNFLIFMLYCLSAVVVVVILLVFSI